jgi:hypothetical protein
MKAIGKVLKDYFRIVTERVGGLVRIQEGRGFNLNA